MATGRRCRSASAAQGAIAGVDRAGRSGSTRRNTGGAVCGPHVRRRAGYPPPPPSDAILRLQRRSRGAVLARPCGAVRGATHDDNQQIHGVSGVRRDAGVGACSNSRTVATDDLDDPEALAAARARLRTRRRRLRRRESRPQPRLRPSRRGPRTRLQPSRRGPQRRSRGTRTRMRRSMRGPRPRLRPRGRGPRPR